MPAKASPRPIRTVYCPNCHLSTRAASERCLHCGRALLEDALRGGAGAASPHGMAPHHTTPVAAWRPSDGPSLSARRRRVG